MRLTRRTALLLTGAAAMAGASMTLSAKPRPKKVLILGGTGFIGPHFVRALMAGGHTVTLFNRGKRDAAAHPGVEQLLGDRDGKLEALANRAWDVAIDNSGYYPRIVRMSAELLKPRVPHYVFISSVAAYRDFAQPDMDEDYPLAKLEGPVVEEWNTETYGPLKAQCEAVVSEVYGRNATHIRPTFIAGPGDLTDRFTYWPWRMSQGGEMLAPGTRDDLIEYIDVRDVADFVALVAAKHITGAYHIVGPPKGSSIGGLLETSRRVTSADTKVTWAPVEFLRAQGLLVSRLQRGTPLPVWLPPGGENAGFGLRSVTRSVAKGMKFRSMDETVRDTLAWQRSRPAENQTLKAGLPPQREAELLALLHGA